MNTNTRILILLLITSIFTSGLYNLDATPVTIASGFDTDWNNLDQTIVLTCADIDGNCVFTTYRIDGGDYNTVDYDDSNEVLINFTITTDGNHQVDFNSADNDNNQEITNTIFVAIDKTKPVTEISGNSLLTTDTNQIITLICSDGNSGCNSTKYRIDGNGSFLDYGSPIVVSTDGNHLFEYYSIDNATNEEEIKSVYISILIPNYSPVTTISGNLSGWTNSNQTITLSCVDYNGVADCNSTKYKIDNTSFIDYTVPVVMSIDGNHLFQYYSIDNNFHTETIKSVYIAIDKTAPTVTLSTSNITTSGAKINVSLNETANCKYSTNSSANYSSMSSSVLSGTSFYWSISGLNDDTDYTYYVACVDIANNYSIIKHVDFSTTKSSSSSGGSDDDDDDEDEDEPLKLATAVSNATVSLTTITAIEAALRLNNYNFSDKIILTNNSEIEVTRKTTGTVTNNKGNFYFTINVKNKTNKDRNVSIIEIVPKEIASIASKITFITQPTKIINADPIVLWDVMVPANKDINLTYKVMNITNTKVIKDNKFIRDWTSAVALVKKEVVVAAPIAPIIPINTDLNCIEDNDNCTEEIIENGVCVHKNICTTSPITGEITLKPKTAPNFLWLLIIGSIFAITMIGVGISEISKNSNSMGYGFKHHIQGLFSSNKRRRR